ncbi:hypothetical protein B0O99DRAFT_587368 [Bisporella sp. PMI_857]|nr:hypothetical protein B0O99DRAFT_587368 [Bisporella sp. PMI_857]
MDVDVISLPVLDNHPTSIEPDLACELCFKSYQRRDLLMRHRRRCQGPRKLTNRRKACDACVQAKVKCCYTQPTCTRCAKRGAQCIYTTSSTTATPQNHAEQRNKTADTPHSSLQSSAMETSSSSGMETFVTSKQPFELDLPAWDFSASSYSLESFDMTMAELANPSPVKGSSFNALQSTMIHESPDFPPPGQTLSLSPASRGIPALPPLAPPSSDSSSSAATPPSPSTPPPPSTSLTLVRALSKYPALLMKGSFFSPFLHLSLYSLYSNVVPDMTFLPQTSMAICCSSGINMSDSNRFFRRAMDAARQRLIGGFSSLECMQKWDALHAMLIYEIVELRESISDESEEWMHNPRVKGLGSPFLLKMTEIYCRSYPEIRNPDYNVFSDPHSSPCSAATTSWARWRITETARRTVFFANILNFYSNRNHNTGKQLAYYEPLNDDLILNMPLPCSQAAWAARTKEDWKFAMMKHPTSASHLLSSFNNPGCEAISSEMFLKNILSQFSKEYLQIEIGTSVGFGNSDELRRLIILCATEQFA